MWALSMRLLLAGFLLAIVARATGNPLPRGAALVAAAQYGVLSFGVSLSLLYWAETQIPTGLAAVVYSISPIASMLVATAFGLEKLEPRRLAAGAVALGGVAIIFWNELAAGRSAWGVGAVLCAAIVSIVGSVLVKKGPKQSSLGLTAAGSFIGLPIVLAASFVMGERRSIPNTASEWIPLAYLVLAGSLGAFVLFGWLLQRWRTSSVSFLGVIVPIVAVILGAIARNESLTPGALVGGAAVLAATVYALWSESASESG